MIVSADKGNCTVVVGKPTYKEKLFILVDDGVYEHLKDSTSKVERKAQKLLFKHKLVLSIGLQQKLTLYHSKPPHLYGLPKIHRLDIFLRCVVSSVGSQCSAVMGFFATHDRQYRFFCQKF
jgi:hypothetical protein